jgi:uncharacterized protein (TIGR03000 family)
MRARIIVCLSLALLQSTATFACWRPFGGLFAGIFRGGRTCHMGNGYYGGYQNVYYGGGTSCGIVQSSPSICSPCPPSPGPSPIQPGKCCEPGTPNEITPPPTQVAENRAYIILEGVPSGATLTVDGVDYTKSGPAPEYRTFRTPVLKSGKYSTKFVVKYLTAPNKMAIGERTVVYKPNERARVNLKHFQFEIADISPKAAPLGQEKVLLAKTHAKAAPATLQWDVPADSQVYIDGKLVEGADEQRITTPPLDPGKRYTFDVAVKYALDGKTVAFERSLEFAAGEAMVMGLTEEGPVTIAMAQYPESFQLALK